MSSQREKPKLWLLLQQQQPPADLTDACSAAACKNPSQREDAGELKDWDRTGEQLGCRQSQSDGYSEAKARQRLEQTQASCGHPSSVVSLQVQEERAGVSIMGAFFGVLGRM